MAVLEPIASELVFALGFIAVAAFVAASISSLYAQQRVANTIELGVQGIVGVDTLREVDEAVDEDNGGN